VWQVQFPLALLLLLLLLLMMIEGMQIHSIPSISRRHAVDRDKFASWYRPRMMIGKAHFVDKLTTGGSPRGPSTSLSASTQYRSDNT